MAHVSAIIRYCIRDSRSREVSALAWWRRGLKFLSIFWRLRRRVVVGWGGVIFTDARPDTKMGVRKFRGPVDFGGAILVYPGSIGDKATLRAAAAGFVRAY